MASKYDIAEIVYDTLMDNVDNEQLDTSLIENQTYDDTMRTISFDYRHDYCHDNEKKLRVVMRFEVEEVPVNEED